MLNPRKTHRFTSQMVPYGWHSMLNYPVRKCENNQDNNCIERALDVDNPNNIVAVIAIKLL